jgi:hypothetical protein
MATAVVGQRDWLTTALRTKERIESTNARSQEEWKKIRAADPCILDEHQHIDASDWQVGGKATGSKDHRVALILWRLDAIIWRLNIINNWLDTITRRLSEPRSDYQETIRNILLDIKPSVEDIGSIFQEINAYVSQVKNLIREIRRSWLRYTAIFLFSMVGTVGAGVLGVTIGLIIANWVGV